MSAVPREYSSYAGDSAKEALESLLKSTQKPEAYSKLMESIGALLGEVLNLKLDKKSRCLVASTAEDADFLSKGLFRKLKEQHETKAAVFWNNHYSINEGKDSIAPVVHRFLQEGFENADEILIVKSIISGSCVVKTNLLELIDKVNPKRIHIVAPVMYEKSAESLKNEFPDEISQKFEFTCFAVDKVREPDGTVRPGIGGEVYGLLGLADQPAKISFIPSFLLEEGLL